MQNLKLSFRQLKRTGLFTLLNIAGLFIGFTVFIVITGIIFREISYDDFWEDGDRLYRIALEQYQDEVLQFRMAQNYRGVSDLLVLELPEVEKRVRLHKDRVTVFAMEQQIQDVDMYYADTCIFSVLKRKILFRESSELFPDIHSVVISSSLARGLYGSENPVGKPLKLNEGWKFFVSAVFEDIPVNSHMHFDLLLTVESLMYYLENFNNVTGQLEDNASFEYSDPGPYDQGAWGMFYGYTYIMVRPGTEINKLQEKANSLVSKVELPDRLINARINLLFQPVSDIHLRSDLEHEMKSNGSIFKVHMLILIACIVLIISLINFFNLSTVMYSEQTKDLAVRIIHGAGMKDILSLFFLNGLWVSLSAGFLSLLFISLFSDQLPGSFPSIWFKAVLLIILILTASVTVLILPFTHLRSNKLLFLLRKDVYNHFSGRFSRQILVVFQFTTSIILIAGTIVIFSQIQYMQKRDLGFSPENIIYTYSPMTMNQRPDIGEKLMVFRSEMEKLPGVKDFCTSSSIPGTDYLMHTEDVVLMGTKSPRDHYFNLLNVDHRYIMTFNLKLLAGRNFNNDHNYNSNELILNRMAAENLGLKDLQQAPGEFVLVNGRQFQIVGIVENFHHLSLKNELTPVLIFKSLTWTYAVGYYSFKLNTVNNEQTIRQIGEKWTEIYPGERFLFKYLETGYKEQYKAEKTFSRTFTLASILAVFISCMGLLGFSRYSIVKRSREIGIRKTFGACREDILRLLNSEIVKLILISAVIGIPVCWYLMNRWLMHFAFRIKPEWWMLAAGSILALLIALLTVVFFSLKAARQNPGEVLRFE